MTSRWDGLEMCNRCGFCETVCPSFYADPREALSPRGRNQILRALVEGKLSDPSLARESLETCLLCDACTTVCPPGVLTAEFVAKGRAAVPTSAMSRMLRILARLLLPRPMLLRFFLRIAPVFRRFLPPSVRFKGTLDGPGRRMSWRAPKGRSDPILSCPEMVWYFPACGVRWLRPDVGLATLRLLKALGLRPVWPKAVCCGLLAKSLGDEKLAQRLRQRNTAILSPAPSWIVCDDASCAAHLARYSPEMSKRVRLVSEVAAEAPLAARPSRQNEKVAFHDPCQSYHERRSTEPARKALKKAGAEVREPPDAGWCCGGAGTYFLFQPEISRKVLERKAAALSSTGAEVWVTEAISCLNQLEEAAGWQTNPPRVLHLAAYLLERTTATDSEVCR